ncbi:MAG: glycosyltransferase [Hyphomicrobiaceae bacterium]
MGDGTPAGAVVVLGMHRSGTSALTRGLRALGIELGDNLKPPVAGDNDKGFFEDAGLSSINDDLLHLWKGGWDSLHAGGSEAQDPALRALSLKACEIVRRQFGSVPYFAFKDPRTARNLPFWKQVFQHVGATPYYVIVFRNPLSTARSLAARDGFPHKKSYFLWLLHMLDAVCGTENEHRIFIEYDDLLGEPDAQLARIASFIDDARVNVSYPEARAYGEDFLEKRLRHHSATEEDLALDPASTGLLREAYRLLRVHARPDSAEFEPDTKAAWHHLRDAFHHVASFGSLIDEVDAERRQWLTQASAAQTHAEELRARLTDAEARLAEGEANGTALAQGMETARATLEAQWLTQASAAQAHAEELRTRLADAEARLAEGEAHRTALAQESETARVTLEAHRQAAAETHRQAVAELSTQITTLTETLNTRHGELSAMRDIAQQKEGQVATLIQSVAARDADIKALQHSLDARQARLDAAHTAWHARTAELDLLQQAVRDRDSHIGSLQQAVRDRDSHIGSLQQAMRDRDGHAASLQQLVAVQAAASAATPHFEQRAQLLEQQVSILNEHANELRAAIRIRDELLQKIHVSTSWRVTHPLRKLKSISQNENGWRLPGVPAQPTLIPDGGMANAVVLHDVEVPQRPLTMAFFTICSRNFLAYARSLFQSLKAHHPEAAFFVALCDRPDPPFVAAEEPFAFVYLDDLDLPHWQEMAERYNITEFNTAIKPFVFRHLMTRNVADTIVYLDPDILVKSRMVELAEAFRAGAPIVLTPHVLAPAENVEVSDIKMLQFGIYNLGFIGLRNAPDVRDVVDWWGRRLIDQCIIKLDEGLFVDQKWADLFPAFASGTHVLRHPGYNVAYWNVSQRKVELRDGAWLVNGLPLRFAHFSGSKLDDPAVFSRHSGQFNKSNIGDLALLLDEYRALVYAQGHARYQAIPYAFNWDGAGEVNLHTPRPEHQSKTLVDGPAGILANGKDHSAGHANGHAATGLSQRYLRRRSGPNLVTLARTARQMAGGWPRLADAVGRAIRNEGIGGVRRRVRLVRAYSETYAPPITEPSVADLRPVVRPPLAPRSLLFIDWSTPRPDHDAGSITAFRLMELFTTLGYDVTFAPSDLTYLPDYTEGLRSVGIRCLYREDIGSVREHLAVNGRSYDFVFLCRAPIAALYIDDIRRFAPGAKIILNTSDLHYLREMREAEISGSKEKIAAAEVAKTAELSTIRKCDVTIVMSAVEVDILRRALPPETDVRLMPLMFVDVEQNCPPFEARRGIVFIGGFPHPPNVDAVLYFTRDIFPMVRAKLPDVTFHVVGNAPPPDVTALGDLPGVQVHGFVKDIGAIFNRVRVSVAPLRYGAGIKGKVGTSLSYGVPAVATTMAAEGMEYEPGRHLLVADDPADFALQIVRAHEDRDLWNRLSEGGRAQTVEKYSVVAGQRRLSALMGDLDPKGPQLHVFKFESGADYRAHQPLLADDLAARANLEQALVRHEAPNFFIEGYCAVCGTPSTFNTSFMYSYQQTADGKPLPNWREHLDCVGCRLQNRLRAAMHLFHLMLRPRRDAKIYVTEQTTRLFAWLKARYPNVTGSEFIGGDVPLGSVRDGLRNEDLTSLTFADQSFDYILSFDVMEHVADDVAALRECFRCLKPGGRLLFAAPFSKDRDIKLVRARTHANGEIEHVLPPEYHGNPVDPENGSLCFRYFAWDLLEDLKGAGFAKPQIMSYWSKDYAYLGGEQFIFLAERPL